MRKSVFLKLALFIIPVVLICEAVQLNISYRSIYDSNFETVSKLTESSAATVREMFKYFDMHNEKNQAFYSKRLDNLCESWGVTYLYVMDIDIDANLEKYLAIGFGKDAAENVKESRYAGVVVKDTVSEAQIKALTGDEESIIVHEITPLDDTLTCYCLLNEQVTVKDSQVSQLDKPLLIGAEISFLRVKENFQNRFIDTAIYDLLFTFALTAAIFIIIFLRINGPLRKISGRMKSFVSDRDKGFEKLQIKGNDELAEMSRSFNSMAVEIDTYIKDIDSLNKEKHVQQAELDIARSIQTGLLKPAHFENDRYSIHACMYAAKNVGGDLYDYHVLDDGRVFIAVADVSGKGISAALFMSRAITLLHQYALFGYTPERMLREYNNTLAEQNPNGLFITTFVAMYDPQTHELTYANAGHNHPYVLKDTLVELDGAAGVAAGIFDGLDYEQETVILDPGDVVFLYTDGVNEAENSRGEMYGTETLENELKKHLGAADSDISDAVQRSVKAFSGDAVQSDDMTILTLKVGPAPVHDEITVKNKAENLTVINEIIQKQNIPAEIQAQLLLIAEELFINICSYAYKGKEGGIQFALDIGSDQATLTFADAGEPFDPTSEVLDIEEYDHENSIGGLGRFLVFELADTYAYNYENGKNKLMITKKY